MEKKFYGLHDVKELKKVERIEEANNLLKEKWLLLAVETTKENLQKYLLGRIG